MKQYRIRLESSELRFYEADGWNEDLLESCLDQGELQHMHGYYRLAHTPSPASFNVERLTDLTETITDHSGKPLLPKERGIYLKYYSSHGIYTHGAKH